MLTDDESAELAELRRRAWGEHPDILDDPTALARLEELEGKVHPQPLVEREGAGSREPVDPQAAVDAETDLGGSARSDSVVPTPHPLAADASSGASGRVGPGTPSRGDPRGGAESPLVERGRNDRDETPQAGADAPSGSPRPSRRRAWLVAGGIMAVVVIASVGGSILTGRPSPSPSPSPSSIAPPVAAVVPAPYCGGGWGLAGTLNTPDGKPVWSRSFDQPPTSITVIPKQGGRVYAEWVNLDVRPDTVADVTVAKPITASLFYTDVPTWTQQPSPETILANTHQSVIIPTCPNGDSYPGYVLASAPTCVTLEFTINGTEHYTVNTAVGIDEGARCPAP